MLNVPQLHNLIKHYYLLAHFVLKKIGRFEITHFRKRKYLKLVWKTKG